MDKLLKLSQEHGEVFESLTFFKKAMSVSSVVNNPCHFDEFNKFFQEYVFAHFKYEENQIFPVVLKSGLIEAKLIVRELQSEHIEILLEIDKYQDLVKKSCDKPKMAQIKKTTVVAQKIISLIIPHARKEDSRFFPLVKKLGIKL